MSSGLHVLDCVVDTRKNNMPVVQSRRVGEIDFTWEGGEGGDIFIIRVDKY